MTTYDIGKEFFELQELLNLEEFDELTGELIDNSETIKELSDNLMMAKEEKADGISYIIKDFKDSEASLASEIKRLQERKAMMVRKQEQLKQLLGYLLHGEKLKTDKFTFFYATTQKVIITDDTLIPEKFLKVEYKVDKALVKKQLQEFKEVEGATLEITESLRIR
jgi:hypothetical protein